MTGGREASDRVRVQPLQPSARHLEWLYLLICVPWVTEWLEEGTLNLELRQYLAAGVMTLFVVVALTVVIQQSKRIGRETQARIRSNEQLQHANRLVTVGRLAAGIAHELGSPLQVVAGRAKMIATGETAAAEAKESGRVIHTQAQQMTQIIRGLLDFARRRPAQRATADLREIANETQLVLGPIAKEKAVVLEIRTEGPVVVHADLIQIKQALTNLVMNAIQAVRGRGHVTLSVAVRRATPPLDHSGAPGSYARLEVRDDGPGIAEEDISRIFEPFFTTKDVGEGTGLGLAVAHGLVQENGGWIAVESQLGKGACFSIFLPFDGKGGST